MKKNSAAKFHTTIEVPNASNAFLDMELKKFETTTKNANRRQKCYDSDNESPDAATRPPSQLFTSQYDKQRQNSKTIHAFSPTSLASSHVRGNSSVLSSGHMEISRKQKIALRAGKLNDSSGQHITSAFNFTGPGSADMLKFESIGQHGPRIQSNSLIGKHSGRVTSGLATKPANNELLSPKLSDGPMQVSVIGRQMKRQQ